MAPEPEDFIRVEEAARRLRIGRTRAYVEARRYVESGGAEGIIPGDPRRTAVPGPGGPPRGDRRRRCTPSTALSRRRQHSPKTPVASLGVGRHDPVPSRQHRPFSTPDPSPLPARRCDDDTSHPTTRVDPQTMPLRYWCSERPRNGPSGLGCRRYDVRQRRRAACLVTPNAAPTSAQVAPSARARATSSPARLCSWREMDSASTAISRLLVRSPAGGRSRASASRTSASARSGSWMGSMDGTGHLRVDCVGGDGPGPE